MGTPSSPPPIALQTLWRSGGTYFAFKLRRPGGALLFYEPLHEDYTRYRAEDWRRFAEAGLADTLGHPEPVTEHYLSDFPFVPDGGVRGHAERFAWERFVLRPDEVDEELAGYLGGLADHAGAAGARAVFKFCRGFLRSGWIERTLGARTVYLVRDPAETAGAYQTRNAGSYFYSGYLRIARLNAADPTFSDVQARLDEAVAPELADPAVMSGDDLAGLYDPELKLDLFYYFWILALAAHLRPDVLIVEVADFGGDAEARAGLADRLGGALEVALDFEDGRPLPSRNLPDRRRIADPVLREAARRAWAAAAVERAPLRTAAMAEALVS